MKVLISNRAASLETAKTHVTVEAEYGDSVVSGSYATIAHHGDRAENVCPCLYKNADFQGIRSAVDELKIGVSHFDLDSLGGVLAVVGTKPTFPGFWECAAWVDVHGPHRLRECPEWSQPVEDRLNAFWAWSESHRCFPPRDGSVEDATEFFKDAARHLESVLSVSGNAPILESGRSWAEEKEQIAERSFKGIFGDRVLLRSDNTFVNHLYAHNGMVYDAVVGFNMKTGSITLSFELPGIGNACKIMQELFGEEAGGHAGIAGTPRDIQYSLDFAEAVARYVAAIMKNEGYGPARKPFYDLAESLWGDTLEQTESGETDVGGFPISGSWILKNSGKMVGGWGPTSRECCLSYPDGQTVYV